MSHQERHSTREGEKSIPLDSVRSVVCAQFKEERAQIEFLLSSLREKDNKFIHERGTLELELLPRIEELLIGVMERAVFGETPPQIHGAHRKMLRI